jgi:hypothetical protein
MIDIERDETWSWLSHQPTSKEDPSKKHGSNDTREFEMMAVVECEHTPEIKGGQHTPPEAERFPIQKGLYLSIGVVGCRIFLTEPQEHLIERMIKKHVESLRRAAREDGEW